MVLEHSRLLLDEDYMEERCQALVRFARRYQKDRNLVLHDAGFGCCRMEEWKVTEATVLSRSRSIASETKPNPRRG